MATFDGKVALVTGGARGLGRTHALTFARAGADVVICDVARQVADVPFAMGSRTELQETAALVEAEGRRCVTFEADVRDTDALDHGVRDAVEKLGRLDIAVANAAIWKPAPVVDMDPDAWNDVIGVNLTGVFNTIRAAGRIMRDAGSGRIVAVASVAGRQGMPNMSNYVASKWGVIGLVKSAAAELGQYGITVNAVCPSTVRTPATDNAFAYGLYFPDKSDANSDDIDAMMRGAHALPVGWLEAQDISDAIAFLASDKARYITGTALDVSAGLSVQYGA